MQGQVEDKPSRDVSLQEINPIVHCNYLTRF
jgi:hypothetical protein